MVTQNDNGMVRVTVTLEPTDVALLDSLARLEGSNRSAELRGLLAQVRPVMATLVRTFEEAERQRKQLDAAMVSATVSEMESILPEAEDLSRRFMGMIAKLEGAATAADAPASNTGATEL